MSRLKSSPVLFVRFVLFVLFATTGPAFASGPEIRYAATFGGVAIREAFPGYVYSASDRGVMGSASASLSHRVSQRLKLGFEVKAGGQRFERFSELSRGWIAGAFSARSGATQFVLEPSWTPRRVKFPSVPEDAAFSRTGLRLGVRQGIGPAMRLRVEGRFERDNFVSAFDARDDRERALYLQLDGKLSETLTLRGSFETGAARATDPKHSHDDHVAGGGVAWSFRRWRLDSGIRSGLSRYTLAEPSASNYRRRDQWLEWNGTIARDLGNGLEAGVRAQITDQSSSRIERSYTTGEYRFQLSWATPGL